MMDTYEYRTSRGTNYSSPGIEYRTRSNIATEPSALRSPNAYNPSQFHRYTSPGGDVTVNVDVETHRSQPEYDTYTKNKSYHTKSAERYEQPRRQSETSLSGNSLRRLDLDEPGRVPEVSSVQPILLSQSAMAPGRYSDRVLNTLSSELETVRQSWRREGSALRQRMLDLHKDKRAAEATIAELRAKLDRERHEHESEREHLREMISDREREIEAVKRETKFRDSARDSTIEDLQRKLTEALTQVSEAEYSRNSAIQEAQKYKKQAHEHEKSVNALCSERDSMRKEVQTQKASLNDLTLRLNSNLQEAQRKAEKEHDRLREQVMQASQTLHHERAELSQKRDYIQRLEMELEHCRLDMSREQKARQELENKNHELRRMLNVADDEFEAVASAVRELSR